MCTGAVYICTEDAFPNKRLRQLAECFSQRHQDLRLGSRQLSDNIFVEHAATTVSIVWWYDVMWVSMLYVHISLIHTMFSHHSVSP